MAVHFPSSCCALIWHSATPLMPAEHMAPLTLHPPSDPAWEMLLHELRDSHGGWRAQVAFCFAFHDKPTFSFPLPDSPSLSLSLLPFTGLNFVLFPAHSNSHSGQCHLADRQLWSPFGVFCCSGGICINIWHFLTLPRAVQYKKLFLSIRNHIQKGKYIPS